MTTAEPAQALSGIEVTAVLSTYVGQIATDLGKVATPEAIAAVNALSAAMHALAEAYLLAANVLADGLPTEH
ncbi:hypothetical protein [Methylobacterium sp. GC_Met_2]|uniref:hypothetical protein n=1 Tax=Methylobacterium sp. GC_Met_2 TaxID=2937376 RepID=UPI00226B9B88|nr:hypothetical protein [Methylobacterium sp. GC_Met_2]